jgi:flagellar basal body rod protein FlgC
MTTIAPITQVGLTTATQQLNSASAKLANAWDSAPVRKTGYQASTVNSGSAAIGAVTLNSPPLASYDPTSTLDSAHGDADGSRIGLVSDVSNTLAAGRAFDSATKVLKVADRDTQTLLNIQT